MISTKLAHYEITAHLGSGGFGDVYQATDLKLGRSVAIKLLPEAFARDSDRVSRFEREARVLASLNHPNIAVIHGFEDSGGRKFLVMELVPGETLQARLRRGPIAVDEALPIAKQIAEALEAAHEKGVIHRDLKPGNVMLTGEGRVKVLDFGLAKACQPDPSDADLSNSPTLSAAATNAGVILGTAAYMSPEQARGKAIDKRADIFAFGCVLYEMLAGRQTFVGDDVTGILSAVLRMEPEWARLPANVPLRVRDLLRLCLEKNVKNRRGSATDVRIDIELALKEPEEPGLLAAVVVVTVWRRALPWTLTAMFAVLLVSALLVWAPWRPAPVPTLRKVFAGIGAEASLLTNFGASAILSPDGTTLAFVALQAGQRRLFVRKLDQLQATALAGTGSAAS